MGKGTRPGDQPLEGAPGHVRRVSVTDPYTNGERALPPPQPPTHSIMAGSLDRQGRESGRKAVAFTVTKTFRASQGNGRATLRREKEVRPRGTFGGQILPERTQEGQARQAAVLGILSQSRRSCLETFTTRVGKTKTNVLVKSHEGMLRRGSPPCWWPAGSTQPVQP